MFDFIIANAGFLSKSLGITCLLAVGPMVFGFLLANLMLAASFLSNKRFDILIDTFCFFERGTPVLVQLFIVYYGLPQLDVVRSSPLWGFFQSPIFCALLTFSLNTSAYTYTILSNALREIPKDDVEACFALGMNRLTAFRRVLHTQVMQASRRPYVNEAIILLKGSSIASTITVMEFTGATRKLIALTYDPIPLFILTFLIYYILAVCLARILRPGRNRAMLAKV